MQQDSVVAHLIGVSPDPVFISNHDGALVYSNHAANSMLAMYQASVVSDLSSLVESHAWSSKTPISIVVSGNLGQYQVTATPSFNDDGSNANVMSIWRRTSNSAANEFLPNPGGAIEWDTRHGGMILTAEGSKILGDVNSHISYGQLCALFIPEDKLSLEVSAKKMLQSGEGFILTCQMLAIRRWVTLNAITIMSEGDVVLVKIALTDSTASIEASRDNLLANKVFESSNDGILLTNKFMIITKANPAINEIFPGYDCDSVVGESVFDIFSADGKSLLSKDTEKLIRNGGSWMGQVTSDTEMGTFVWMVSISPMKDAQHRVSEYLIMVSDISDNMRAMEDIERLTSIDQSTGLIARHLFIEKVDEVLESIEGGASMVYIDLDRFKAVNDSLGHANGDEVIKIVAERIVDCVGNAGVVTKFGADAFVVAVMGGKDPTRTSRKIAENVALSIKDSILIGGHDISLGASIGIADFRSHGDNADELVRNSAAAMRASKLSGRNKISTYEVHMNAHAIQRMYVESGLRQAMVQGDLVLYYQPQVDNKGELCGVEALVRWSRNGVITSPAEFIHIAEESGMIIQLGQWALDESCKQVNEWLAKGLEPPPVAVNISPTHFRSDDFAEWVIAALKTYNLDHKYIHIEITETSLLSESDAVTLTLDRLREAGIKVALDDFGTGYSSLSYLHRFAVDKIKIDQVFVRGAVGNKTDMAIILAIIEIAKSIGLHIVAEGVENGELAAVLYEYGCDSIQGYYYSRPVPVAGVTKMLTDKRNFFDEPSG